MAVGCIPSKLGQRNVLWLVGILSTKRCAPHFCNTLAQSKQLSILSLVDKYGAHASISGKPVSGYGGDDRRIAQPLKSGIVQQLTPTMRNFTLNGKVAIVTGGGRGLGYNMSQALAEVGVRGIAIMDVQKDLGTLAAKEMSSHTGVDAQFYQLEVRDEHAVSEAVEDVNNDFGRIDILISSAGIADSNLPAEKYPPDMFRRLLDINVTGTFLIAQACARAMIESNTPGSMVFIASMSGSIVNFPQEQCSYNASKASVIRLTKSLAVEWARYNIRVNSISPNYMDTALNRVPALDAQKKIWIQNTPQKRLGHVDELNNLAVFLASDASTFMTGSNCVIDGGYTFTHAVLVNFVEDTPEVLAIENFIDSF